VLRHEGCRAALYSVYLLASTALHSVYLLTKPLCYATKVVALLFEMRVGLEAGDRALKAAESAVAALNGREDIVKEEVVNKIKQMK
jgi:hypothetical protein